MRAHYPRYRPLLEGRAATALARYFPPMVGEVPAPGTLPADWVTAARAPTSA